MLITFSIHLYDICTKNVFLICLVYFQNCAAIKKKSHIGFKAYPCPNILILLASPRFLCRATALYILLEPWDVRALYVRKTADLPLQLLVGTFARFVAIGFY